VKWRKKEWYMLGVKALQHGLWNGGGVAVMAMLKVRTKE